MNKLILALGVFLLSSTSALAVELVSEDNKVYEVTVTEGSNTEEISIEPATTTEEPVVTEVCTSNCQIEVEGIGSVNAEGDEVITISEDGAIVLPEESI